LIGPDGGSTASVMAGETVRACRTSSMHWKSSMLGSPSEGGCGADVEAVWLLSILSALCNSWGSAAFATCIPVVELCETGSFVCPRLFAITKT